METVQSSSDLLSARGSQQSHCLVKSSLSSENILKLHVGLFDEISISIGTEWRRLAALACGTRYELDTLTVERCAQGLRLNIESNPAKELLTKFGNRNMTVNELSIMLDHLRLERPLKAICDPVPLTITLQPVSALTVAEGEELVLSCCATGFPYPVYCWFKEKQQLTFSSESQNLVISNVSLSTAGRYLCRIHHTNHITNKNDWLFTTLCTVTIESRPFRSKPPPILPQSFTCPGAPQIVEQPVSQTVRSGNPICLSCKASGQPSPQYHWYKDDNITAISTQHFMVAHADIDNAGQYYCVVENAFGRCRSDNAFVVVQPEMFAKVPVKPRILKQPVDQTVGVGGDVIFSVDVDFCGKLSYQWYHESDVIPGATNSELRLNVDGFYRKGCYQCRVYASDQQEVLSRQAVLSVTPGPTIYKAADKLALFIGVSTYKMHGVSRLPAVEYDLQESVRVFESLEFKVISLLDLTLSEMKAAISLFCEQLSPDVYAVFYCAGHGFVGEDGRHYLIPWDAPHDTNPNESLCIETVEDDIQRTRPKLLMFFLDICRKRHQNIDAPPRSFTRTEAVPNKIVLYAASEGQQAYEESKNPRGLFNQYLLRVIQKPMHAVDLYYAVMDQFKTCKYDRKKYPQFPEMLTSIEDYRRTLHDPIDTKLYHVQINKCMKLMQSIHNIPPQTFLQLANIGKVTVSYERVMSNVMDMLFVACLPVGWRLTVHLHEDSIPGAVRPIQPQTVDKNTTRFRLKNLQHVTENLQMYVSFVLVNETQPSKELPTTPALLDLGRPLISPFDLDRSLTFVEPTERKQAMEHTEYYSLQSDGGS